MRLIHTADWHLGKHLEGQSRMEEQELFLDEFVKIVEEKKADMVLIAGDVYDSPNPPARAEKLFYDTLKRLSDGGNRLTVVIAGNHDNPERLAASAPLAMEHGIIMAGTPKMVIPTGSYGRHQVVESGGGYVKVKINSEQIVLLTVPFPSEKRLNEVLYEDMAEEEEKLQSYNERLRLLFDSLAVHFEEETVNVIVSHLFVMDSIEDGSERSIQLGGSYIVDPAVFPKKTDYAALGHVHKPQAVPGYPHIRYAGSPIEYRKGEERYGKQVLCVDLEAGKAAEIEAVTLKQHKPIEVWKCENVADAIERCRQNRERSCWVYLEIQTDRAILEDEIKEMKQLKSGILEIHPILNAEETEETMSWRERPFREVFAEFYRHERGVEASKETMQTLLALMGREEEPDEAD